MFLNSAKRRPVASGRRFLLGRPVPLLLVSLTCAPFLGFAAEETPPSATPHDNTAGETNAATIYKKATSLMTPLPNDFWRKAAPVIDRGWDGEHEELKQLLIKNQEAVDEFKKATQLADCQFAPGPVTKKYADTEMPQHGKEVSIARMVLLQARAYEKEQKPDLALEDYLSVLRFAHHLDSQKDFILLSKLIAVNVRKLVYLPLVQYVQGERLDAQHGQSLLEALVSWHSQDVGLERAFEEVQEAMRNTMRRSLEDKGWAKREGWANESFYQAVLSEFDNESDKLQDELSGYVRTALRENRWDEYDAQINRLRDEAPAIISPDGLLTLSREEPPARVARKLAARIVQQHSKVATRYYASVAELDTLLAAIAIRLYELKQGRVPDTLQELVPTYLSALPEDPFNGFKPLAYEKKEHGWVVYSLGPDRVDNHGTTAFQEDEPDKSGDIVLSSP